MAAPVEARVFPHRSVIILALVLTTNSYTLANLFPYVGMMVKHLMDLPTTNESGALRELPFSDGRVASRVLVQPNNPFYCRHFAVRPRTLLHLLRLPHNWLQTMESMAPSANALCHAFEEEGVDKSAEIHT